MQESLEVNDYDENWNNSLAKTKMLIENKNRVHRQWFDCPILSQRQKNRKQHTVLVVMYFESCYERIWRAGLLHKASNKGINGRLWLYIKNFIIDRKYCIQVNDFKSPIFQSTIGISQGNMYATDSMSNIVNNHAEFTNASSVWNKILP